MHDIVSLYVSEEIEAPSEVTVEDLAVRWRDNSDNERGFRAILYENGEAIAAKWEWANSTSAHLPFHKVRPGADEYEVRVFAMTHSAFAGSEAVTYRWAPLGAPEAPTNVVATAIEPTTVRLSWSGDSKSDQYGVKVGASGWSHIVRGVDREWVDIKGLARGGIYTFDLWARNEAGSSVPYRTYLSLGSRGRGPQAPSNLVFRLEGDFARLNWKDNADDELGFEVRAGGLRDALLPPNTESAVVSSGYLVPTLDVRVYAYNEHGFSPRSNPVFPAARVEFFGATPGDREVGLTWRVSRAETVTGMQVRWKTGADLPFDDRVDKWTNLVASSRAHTVEGLENGTEYRFEVRALTALGAGLPSGGRATPREGLPPRQPAGSCRSDAQTLCLRDSRFEAKAYWRSADGGSGAARVVNEGTDESGIFEFFGPENWEILLKVLDGCSTNGHVWVLGASTTDLGYRIEVTDTVTGESKRYENEPGQPAPAIIDTEAFSRICDGSAGGRMSISGGCESSRAWEGGASPASLSVRQGGAE